MTAIVTAAELKPGMTITGNINIWDVVTPWEQPGTVADVKRNVHGYIAIDLGHTAEVDGTPVTVRTEVAPWYRLTIA